MAEESSNGISIGEVPTGQKIKVLQEETELARTKLKNISKSLAQMVSTAQMHDEAMKMFADQIASLSGNEPNGVFSKCKDMIIDLSSKRCAAVKRQEEILNSFIKDCVEVRISTALGMQAKVNEAIKEHEAASEKVHSYKKGNPKLADAQTHLNGTQQHMELLSFAYLNKLKQTLLDVSIGLSDKLSLFFGEETLLAMAGTTATSSVIPELTKVQVELKKIRHSNDEERAVEMKRHLEDSKATTTSNFDANQIKQGYLWARTSGRYKHRWVSLINSKLLVYKNWKSPEAKITFNLLLCSVKRLPPDSSSHPFVFEVRSNMDEYQQFAVTDEIEGTQWVSIIQHIIASQLGQVLPNSTTSGNPQSPSNTTHEVFDHIASVKGNDVCADCRAPHPEWVSIVQGIVICIECSGVHRSFGSHISKVRSLKLDSLEPELVLLMTSIGNFKANSKIFEATMPESSKIGPSADRASREAFLKAKYVEKRWIKPVEDINAALTALIRRKNPFSPVTLLSLLVQPGVDINWKRPGNQRSLLHKCVFSQNILCSLLLLKRGCLVDIPDAKGLTPLHLAAEINSAPLARLLLQNGASMSSLDVEKRTPRDVAIDNDSVDCIALLDEDLLQEEEPLSPSSARSFGDDSAIPQEKQYFSLPNLTPRRSGGVAPSVRLHAASVASPGPFSPKKRKAQTLRGGVVTEEDIQELEEPDTSNKKNLRTATPTATQDDTSILTTAEKRKSLKKLKSVKSVVSPSVALPPPLSLNSAPIPPPI